MRRRARWVALGSGLAVALAVGLIGARAWSRGGDWPARRTIRPPAGSWPVGLTHDGRSYRTGHESGMTTWDLATGRGVMTPPERFVWRKGFSADGRRYAGMINGDFVADGVVAWGDAATDAVERTFPAPNLQIRQFDLDDGERTIRAVAGLRDDSTVVITWDIATGAESRRAIRGPGAGYSRPLAFAPGGQTWAYLDKGRDAVQVWDGAADRPLGPPLRTPTTARNLAAWAWAAALFTSDGRTLIVGRSDGQAEFWDLGDFHLLRVVRLFPAGYTVMHMTLAPDGRTLAASGHLLPRMNWAGRHWDAAHYYITGEYISETTQEAVLLDLPTGRVVARSPGSVGIGFTPDSRSVVTIERDQSITIRDIPLPEAR